MLMLLLAAPAAAEPRLPAMPNDEAWKRLPSATEASQPLPIWARILAKPMPMTTARMLELDALHRSGDRLDARLRAITRWAAADGTRCEYSKAVAAADLRRAGAADRDVEMLAKHPERLPALERVAFAFARKMMREAHAVTDAEFKQLLDVAGEDRVVAIVALLAHARFQDHLFLALNLPEEPEGILPVTAKFGRPKPSEGGPPPDLTFPMITSTTSPAWTILQDGLDKQRARAGRIRVPSREDMLKRLGNEKHPATWQAGILWSRVCYGYQPELTDAWFDCSGAFRQESDLDRLLPNTIFWVITQSLQCFY
jgi:alkylhydroperoxidase family enzyme